MSLRAHPSSQFIYNRFSQLMEVVIVELEPTTIITQSQKIFY